jgi:hypothetical protein
MYKLADISTPKKLLNTINSISHEKIIDTISAVNVVGETVSIPNTDSGYVDKLELLGNTTGGGGTPSTPIALVSPTSPVKVVSMGKNLFDYANTSFSGQNATVTKENNGYTVLSSNSATVSRAIKELTIRPNTTITVSMKAVLVGGSYDNNSLIMLRETSNGGASYGQNTFKASSTPAALSIQYTNDTSSTKTIYLWLYNKASSELSTDYAVRYYDIQIEKGSTATDYEPYSGTETSIPLLDKDGNPIDILSVSAVRDRIYTYNGKAYLQKKCKSTTSDVTDALPNSAYIGTTGNGTVDETGAIIVTGEVIYELATPQIIELHADTATALEGLKTYQGTTNIFGTNTVNPILDVTELAMGIGEKKYALLTDGDGNTVMPVNKADNVILSDGRTVEYAISNIDNTSDLDKPISTATQTALELKADKEQVDTVINNNGTVLQASPNLLEDLHFNFTKLITKATDNMKILDLDFERLRYSTKIISNVYQLMGTVGIAYGANGLTASATTSSEMLMKTGISLKVPSIEMRSNFISTTTAGIRLGICKDADNFIVASWCENGVADLLETIVKIAGTQTAITLYSGNSGLSNTATLEMLLNNNIVTVIISDGTIRKTYETDISSYIDLTTANLSDWNLAIGSYVEAAGAPMVIKDITASYGYGKSIGGDFRVITYEDGSPIKEGNSVFVTATNHSTELIGGHGGINVYKLDMSVFELTLVGRVFQKVGTKTTGAATAKILYDRDTHYWYYSATDFNVSPNNVFVGKTKIDLRYGVNVVTSAIANITGGTVTSIWEMDFVKYDGNYKIVFIDANKLVTATATDITEVITIYKQTATYVQDGTSIAVVGGQLRITFGRQDLTGLDIYDFDHTLKGTMAFDYWMGDTSTLPVAWGSILPIQKRDYTEYYFLLYDICRWESLVYSYGNMCVYKAEETNLQELKSNNIINF